MSACSAHAIKILHSSRGWDRINASRMSQNFYLIDQSCRYVLGNHEARIQTWVWCQEKRCASFVPIMWPHQIEDTSFRETCNLRKSNSQSIECYGQGLSIKISAT